MRIKYMNATGSIILAGKVVGDCGPIPRSGRPGDSPSFLVKHRQWYIWIKLDRIVSHNMGNLVDTSTRRR